MVTLYHGTNNPDTIGLRRPRSGNTAGFYLTPDMGTAQGYGSSVLAFEVPSDTTIKFIIRPLGSSSEWLVTNQADFNNLMSFEV